jgi:hypothetical protein
MSRARQVASQVLLIRPKSFGPNPQTALSNPFQQTPVAARASIQAAAAIEFSRLEAALRDAGVFTTVFDDTVEPEKPDAIFPNNWISSHEDGTVVLYPMATPNRRLERRVDIINTLAIDSGLAIGKILDLTALEGRGFFLEGTGSLVLDRLQRIAYAALSGRTHLQALTEFARQCGYQVFSFDTRDRQGAPVYHTNIVMSLGESFAVVCAEAISDVSLRNQLLVRLNQERDLVIEITMEQMDAFAGNILELAGNDGHRLVAMSSTAWDAFTRTQRRALADRVQIVAVPIPTIEQIGGGSVRCMIAEVFLPARSSVQA